MVGYRTVPRGNSRMKHEVGVLQREVLQYGQGDRSVSVKLETVK